MSSAGTKKTLIAFWQPRYDIAVKIEKECYFLRFVWPTWLRHYYLLNVDFRLLESKICQNKRVGQHLYQ